MKRKFFVTAICAIFCFVGALNAQAPYKHSVGATLGSMQAFSYKTFVTDHFAIQVDLGTKILCTDSEGQNHDPKCKSYDFWNLELNPNFLYEGNFVSGLYGFAGGGVSLGYSWDCWRPDVNHFHWDMAKFGVNAMLGLEYKLNIPLALQFDFRPGYGIFFNDIPDYIWHHFDWSVNAGVRYTF